jgi:hypothetical protein
LYLRGSNWAVIGSGGDWSNNFNKNNDYQVKVNAEVEIEVDVKKKVIYYFINSKYCPYYISDVFSFPLLFGISGGLSNAILEVVSVKKMVKSSVDSSVPCKAINWK